MAIWGTNYKHSSDEELMLLIKTGKTKAFDELYDRYHKRMHYFFYRMLYQDEMMADDFLQELFLKIIEKPQLFHTEKVFKTWLYTLATNLCKNEYRKNAVRNNVNVEIDESPLHAENEQITYQFDNKIFNNHLEIALEKLEEVQRTCFVLRFQEELSIKEIAEIMYCSEGTVKSRLFYTLKKLSVTLQEFNPQKI